VAEEVRNLAAKSAEAAKDTGGLIENSVSKANLGMSIATETAQSLKGIVDGINQSTGIIEEIANESDGQLAAINHLNTGIGQVSQVTQQNSAAAQESAASAQEMSAQSTMLENLIAKFKLKDGNTGVHGLPPRSYEE
jgi:methyl-accepting chemotaxis protein